LNCKYCGNELPSPDADICTKCGKIVEKPKTTENNSQPTKRTSKAWYLVPIFFGIIGGLVMFLVLRDENKIMAKKGLILGIIMSVVGIAIYGAIFAVLFSLGLSQHHLQ